MNLLDQFEAPQIGFCPPSIFDHSVQGAGAKGLTGTVKEHGHCSAIGMTVGLMAALLTYQDKAIFQQSVDELASRDGSRENHIWTATAKTGLTSTSLDGSVGMGSPAWRRASTWHCTAS